MQFVKVKKFIPIIAAVLVVLILAGVGIKLIKNRGQTANNSNILYKNDQYGFQVTKQSFKEYTLRDYVNQSMGAGDIVNKVSYHIELNPVTPDPQNPFVANVVIEATSQDFARDIVQPNDQYKDAQMFGTNVKVYEVDSNGVWDKIITFNKGNNVIKVQGHVSSQKNEGELKQVVEKIIQKISFF